MVNQMEQNSNTHGTKILLVENSRTARAVLTRQLANWGHQVDSVSNALEAIELIKEQDFSVIILDVFMPMMNGYEAAKTIRALPSDDFKKIKLIALTASEDPNDYKLCMESGMDEFIIKSDNNEALKTAIVRLNQN